MTTLKFKNWQSTAGVTRNTVIQTVTASTTNAIDSTSGTTTVASGFILAITPKYNTSKIRIQILGGNVNWGSTSANVTAYMYRQIGSGGYTAQYIYTNQWQQGTWGIHQMSDYLDSPATTSTVYYQPYYNYTVSNHATLNLSGIQLIMIAQEISQ